MQRGAQKRDRAPTSGGSDYEKVPPSMRDEDRAHLGLTDAAFEKIATSLKDKILGYARAGFRKPADVSRLLNRETIRTAAGTEWNPRLVYFLLGRIYGDRHRKPKPVGQPPGRPLEQNRFNEVRKSLKRKRDNGVKSPGEQRPPRRIKVREAEPQVPLTPDEMSRRLDALKDHFSKERPRMPD